MNEQKIAEEQAQKNMKENLSPMEKRYQREREEEEMPKNTAREKRVQSSNYVTCSVIKFRKNPRCTYKIWESLSLMQIFGMPKNIDRR